AVSTGFCGCSFDSSHAASENDAAHTRQGTSERPTGMRPLFLGAHIKRRGAPRSSTAVPRAPNRGSLPPVGTIAFFDFDGTLLGQGSGGPRARPSGRRGLLGPAIFAELVGTWLLSKVGLRARTDAMRVGFRCYAGRSLAELRALMAELYEQHIKADLSPA